MRAKRSKRYRKTMSSYQMAFSFREPYQVLLDAAFLRTCHSFHMPLQKYLANTLHGECRSFVTQCTLAKIMKDHEKATNGKSRGRPSFLPPPMDLPLRYCKHKNDEGEELGVIEEARCLLDLLAGQPKGNEVPKNKQHYILATADAPEEEQRRRGYVDIREKARFIPGVPIIYVKRSVMILEDLSASSERAKRGAENDNFREGLISNRKRRRGEEDERDELLKDVTESEDPDPATKRRPHKAKGPNPLSVQKKKVKMTTGDHTKQMEIDESRNPTSSRRGKRGKKKSSNMLAEDASDVVGDAVGMND